MCNVSISYSFASLADRYPLAGFVAPIKLSRASTHNLKFLATATRALPLCAYYFLFVLTPAITHLARKTTDLTDLAGLTSPRVQCWPLTLIVTSFACPEEPALPVDDREWIRDRGMIFEFNILRVFRRLGRFGNIDPWWSGHFGGCRALDRHAFHGHGSLRCACET